MLVSPRNKLHLSNKVYQDSPSFLFYQMATANTMHRIRTSPPSNIIARISPSHLDLFLRCFVVDLDAENEDMLRADEAAIGHPPGELRSSHRLPSPTASPSDPLSNTKHFCKTHWQISPKLVTSLRNSLKTLIFHLPAAINPIVYRKAHSMAIVEMESVMDSNYDEMFGWQNDSVFEKCIVVVRGCRQRKYSSTRSLFF